jgi:hypothetical protein
MLEGVFGLCPVRDESVYPVFDAASYILCVVYPILVNMNLSTFLSSDLVRVIVAPGCFKLPVKQRPDTTGSPSGTGASAAVCRIAESRVQNAKSGVPIDTIHLHR